MAVLIDADVIEARLTDLRKRVSEISKWNGTPKEDVTLRAELVFAEMDDALRQAREQWRPISAAAALTGYNEQTLRGYALRITNGRTVPAHWRALEVRRDGRGYEVKVSTIPPHAQAA